MDSGSNRGWESEKAGQRATSLLVQLRQRLYVLPWSLFLYAEGNDGEVQVTFHTHVIAVQGSGLTVLLQEFAHQSITRLMEPDRASKFTPSPGPTITTVTMVETR